MVRWRTLEGYSKDEWTVSTTGERAYDVNTCTLRGRASGGGKGK